MADFADEITALHSALRDVPDLLSQDLTDSPTVPCAMILPDAPFDWHLVFGDDVRKHRFVIWLLVAYTDTRGAQTQLNGYLASSGPRSVSAAIEANGQFEVTSLRSYGVTSLSDEGTRYLSAELVVESLA